MNVSIARCLAAMLFAAAPPALAQGYPTRAITLIVPYSAGGPTDTVARVIAQPMSQALGQTIVVDNRAGTAALVGTEAVARAQPDGYTILINNIAMATVPSLYQQLRFDPLRDFSYIGLINDVPMALITRVDLPPKTVPELVDLAKKSKPILTYAHAGRGSGSHLCGVLLMSAMRADFLNVPYKGTAPALADMLGGRVDVMCDQTSNAANYIKSGRVKVFAVTSARRLDAFPGVPTLSELGYKEFPVGIWHALYAPKGTPPAVIDQLSKALQAALRDATVQRKFAEMGAITMPPERGTPAALEQYLKSEMGRLRPLLHVGPAHNE